MQDFIATLLIETDANTFNATLILRPMQTLYCNPHSEADANTFNATLRMRPMQTLYCNPQDEADANTLLQPS